MWFTVSPGRPLYKTLMGWTQSGRIASSSSIGRYAARLDALNGAKPRPRLVKLLHWPLPSCLPFGSLNPSSLALCRSRLVLPPFCKPRPDSFRRSNVFNECKVERLASCGAYYTRLTLRRTWLLLVEWSTNVKQGCVTRPNPME